MSTYIVILAAGKGTRMKSEKAKVLHEVDGKPMILHVVQSASQVAGDNIIIVVGHQAESVKKTVSRYYKAKYACQNRQLGTGHAVQCALKILPERTENIIVLCGDVPLIRVETLEKLLTNHCKQKRDCSIYGVRMKHPKGYGRIKFDNENKNVTAIVEEADATEQEKKIQIVNTGIYCVRSAFLKKILPQIASNNAQKEYYLTDMVKIGYHQKFSIGAIIDDQSFEFYGVNEKQDILEIEKILKESKRKIS